MSSRLRSLWTSLIPFAEHVLAHVPEEFSLAGDPRAVLMG